MATGFALNLSKMTKKKFCTIVIRKVKFLGWAHSQCNLKRKSITFTPVIANNMAGYDIHHICTIIKKSRSNKKFCVIPTTVEKYISFTFPVSVNSFMDKNGVTKNVYEDMRFLDSFKSMPQSL